MVTGKACYSLLLVVVVVVLLGLGLVGLVVVAVAVLLGLGLVWLVDLGDSDRPGFGPWHLLALGSDCLARHWADHLAARLVLRLLCVVVDDALPLRLPQGLCHLRLLLVATGQIAHLDSLPRR